MKKRRNTKDTRNLAMLRQLASTLDYSLARYLLNARPWVRRPYLLLGAIARRLAIEHGHYAGKIVRLLHARSHNVNGHTYPMEFTYYNDLSLEYLAPRLLDDQHRLINLATAVSTELEGDLEVDCILRTLLASLRKYGSLLEELLAPHRFATSTSDEESAVGPMAGCAPDRVKGRDTRPMESQTAA